MGDPSIFFRDDGQSWRLAHGDAGQPSRSGESSFLSQENPPKKEVKKPEVECCLKMGES
jgi:hypothetical protein